MKARRDGHILKILGYQAKHSRRGAVHTYRLIWEGEPYYFEHPTQEQAELQARMFVASKSNKRVRMQGYKSFPVWLNRRDLQFIIDTLTQMGVDEPMLMARLRKTLAKEEAKCKPKP